MSHDPGARPFFPPEVVVRVKALACELPAQTEIPLSRFSRQDLAREVVARGIYGRLQFLPQQVGRAVETLLEKLEVKDIFG